VVARAVATQGKQSTSSALAAKMTDCSHRRLVFIMHLHLKRFNRLRYPIITQICGISLSPKGKHLEGG
jgi:hypothetical protein